MLRLSRFGHSPLARLAAQLLVFTLVFGMLPAQARAAVPAIERAPSLPELPSLAESVPPALLAVVVAIVGDEEAAPCAVVFVVSDPHMPSKYHRARWYAPGQGRFTGTDPFAGSEFDPRTLHRYLYVAGDPLNKFDPSGEDFLTVGLAVGAIIATIATIASLSTSIPFDTPTYYGLPGPIPPATWFSNQGVEFLKSWEAFRARLYNDQAGQCTIGYGELVHYGPCNGTEPGEFKAGITEARATQLLRDQTDLRFVPAIRQLVLVPLRQHQFDAIVSFVYNIGVNGFSRSGVLLALNTRRFLDAQNEIRRWNRAGGAVSAGLVNRREAEVRLFRIGMYSRY